MAIDYAGGGLLLDELSHCSNRFLDRDSRIHPNSISWNLTLTKWLDGYLPVVIIEINLINPQSLERLCTCLLNIGSSPCDGRHFTLIPSELESDN